MPDNKTSLNNNSFAVKAYQAYRDRYGNDAGSFQNFTDGMSKDENARKKVYEDYRKNGDLDESWNFNDFSAEFLNSYNNDVLPERQRQVKQKEIQSAALSDSKLFTEGNDFSGYPLKKEAVPLDNINSVKAENENSPERQTRQSIVDYRDALKDNARVKKQQVYSSLGIPVQETDIAAVDYNALRGETSNSLKEAENELNRIAPVNDRMTRLNRISSSWPGAPVAAANPQDEARDIQKGKEQETLSLKRQIDALKGIQTYIALNDNLQKASQGQRSALGAAWLNDRVEDILSGGVTKINRVQQLAAIAKMPENERLPEEQRLLTLAASNNELNAAMQKNSLFKTGTAGRELLKFMGDMAITAPVAGAFGAAAKGVVGVGERTLFKGLMNKAARTLVKTGTIDKVAAEGAAKLLPKIIGQEAGIVAASELARTPLMPTVYSGAADNSLASMNIHFESDNDGNIALTADKVGNSWGKSFYKAFANTYLMNTVFHIGGMATNKVAVTAAIKGSASRTMLDKFLLASEKFSSKGLGSKARRGLVNLGINGAVTVPLEIAVSDALGSVATWDMNRLSEMGSWNYWWSALGNGVALHTFGRVMSAPASAMQRAAVRQHARQAYDAAVEGLKNTDVSGNSYLDAVKRKLEDALSRGSFSSSNKDMSGGDVGREMRKIHEYIQEHPKEADAQRVYQSAYKACMRGFALEGNDAALSSTIEDGIGPYINKTNGVDNVTVVLDTQRDKLMYLLDDSGDISIVKDVDSGAEGKPYDVKSDSYLIVSNQPRRQFDIRTIVENQRLTERSSAQDLSNVQNANPNTDIGRVNWERAKNMVQEPEQQSNEATAALEQEQQYLPENPAQDSQPVEAQENSTTPAQSSEASPLEVGEAINTPDGEVSVEDIQEPDETGRQIVVIQDSDGQPRTIDYSELQKMKAAQAATSQAEPQSEQPVEPQSTAQTLQAQESPNASTAQSETQRTNPIDKYKDKNGNVDYNTLLEKAPEMFVSTYESEFGQGSSRATLARQQKRIKEEIKGLQKKLGNVDINKEVEIQRKINALTKKSESIGKILNPDANDVASSSATSQETAYQAGKTITQRWKDAPKSYGAEETMTLQDGSSLHGRWVVSESGAATPSHDPFSFAPSEGFPVTETGSNANSNDYQNDKAKQDSVASKGADYDGRAIDNPVFVKDGVVVSGNNRTMGGIVAASVGRDGKYITALREKAAKFGISASEIDKYSHPRIYFEITDDFPLTTENFARFNAPVSAMQSTSERAVAISKMDTSKVIGQMLNVIGKFNTIGEVYKDQASVATLFKYLIDEGFLSTNELPTYYTDIEGVTAAGKDYLESVLIGSVLNENVLKLLNYEGMKHLRPAIIKALPELLENSKLKENILEDLSLGLKYLYQANRENMSIERYVSQGNFFETPRFSTDAVFNAIVIMSGVDAFKSYVADYNKIISAGIDMFLGRENTKADIYKDYEQSKFTPEQRRILNWTRETNAIADAAKGDIPTGSESNQEGSVRPPEREVSDTVSEKPVGSSEKAAEEVNQQVPKENILAEQGAVKPEQKFDIQGNPIDKNGKLITEKVNSISEIKDEDFINPKRSINLPELSSIVDDAIGANGRPVVIKKNIFSKNYRAHNDLTPSESRKILSAALYSPNLYGQNQKKTKPFNWVLIKTKNAKGDNRLVLLEVNRNKDNVEIVNWHYVDNRGVEKIRRQAIREDGQLLMLPSENSEEVGALSDPTNGTSSEGEGNKKSNNPNISSQEILPQDKLTDVGEKIGGAKKDLYQEYKQRLSEIEENPDSVTEKLLTLPVSKVFDFNLDKLQNSGLDNTSLTVLSVLMNEAKKNRRPIDEFKAKAWLNRAYAAYHICLKIISGDKVLTDSFVRDDFESSAKSRIPEKYIGQVNALLAVGGYSSGLNLSGATLFRITEKTTGKEKWIVNTSGNSFMDTEGYATKEEAVTALKNFAAKSKNKPGKKIDFSIWRKRDDATNLWITVKGKPSIVIQDGFKTADEASKYVKEHYDELCSRWNNLKESTSVKFNKNRERTGNDWRGGKNFSAEQLKDAFDFRGLEFGNWMNPSERQASVNDCYDALMDLSIALGISPKALSLGGQLAMAFGARGGGKFSAHYEPVKVVINLTKTKGAGSLAHEWWHALDNYLARQRGGAAGVNETNQEGYHWDNDNKKIFSNTERQELTDAFRELVSAIKKSSYAKRSENYSSLHSSSYWTEPTELGARSFAYYVERKLAQSGISNDYLANNPSVAEDTPSDYWPYPVNEDFEALDKAYEQLFSTLQEKTDGATGKSILYKIVPGTEDSEKEDTVNALYSAGELASTLGTKLQVFNGDISSLPDSEAEVKRKIILCRATGETPIGWYNVKTGQVWINSSALYGNAEEKEYAARVTVLHEMVGHKGLRALFGERFHSVMLDIYRSLSPLQKQEVKKLLRIEGKINDAQAVIGTEELLSNMAEHENMYKHISLWQRIIDKIRYWLHKLGLVKQIRTDDLLWVLHSSKENLLRNNVLTTSDNTMDALCKIIPTQKEWHGSGAEFDKLMLSYISTGEGAQVYGYGHYVSDSEGVAIKYANDRYSEGKGKFIYRVEISAGNFLQWNRKIYEDKSIDFTKLLEAVGNTPKLKDIYITEEHTVGEVYKAIEARIGKKATSAFLHSLGYAGNTYRVNSQGRHPSETQSNYVIFTDDGVKVIYHKSLLKNGYVKEYFPGTKIVSSVGKYKNDFPIGEHKEYYSNGMLHIIKNYNSEGVREGLTEEYREDGSKISVLNYKDNDYDGVCEYFHPDGKIESHSEYKDGNKIGIWESWYKNGKICSHDEYNKNGDWDGIREEYREDGSKISHREYKDDKFNGVCEYFYPDGKLRDHGEYKDGFLNGIHEEWNENGQKIRHKEYKDGIQNGIWEEWYPDGKKKLHYEYKDNSGTDIHEEWYPDGQKKSHSEWKDGNLNGIWEEWYPDGQKKSHSEWKDGNLNGIIEYFYPDGQKKSHSEWKDGNLNGIHEKWNENGQKISHEEYKDDSGTGIWEEWNENGQKIRHKEYKDGKIVKELDPNEVEDAVRFKTVQTQQDKKYEDTDIRFKLSKSACDGKREYAAKRNFSNEDILIDKGLTPEQADLFTQVASLRHQIHSSQDRIIKSNEENLLGKLSEVNNALSENNLPYMKFIPLYDFIDIDTIDLLREIDSNIPESGTPENQKWYDKNYERIAGELEKLNSNIEEFLGEVDKKYGTEYKPTGQSRFKMVKTPTSHTIKGLEDYSEEDIKEIVTRHFNSVFGDGEENPVAIQKIKIIGSRTNGTSRQDSDLDVLLQYNGDMSEDGLFNLLNEEPLYIEGIKVDINPITEDKSGTIEEFLERNKDYKKEDSGIRFRTVYGGNSGYSGYSMSKRAEQAREEGRYPKTDFCKEYGLTPAAFNALSEGSLGIIDSGEWHHTSMYGNKTKFYHWSEDGQNYFPQVYFSNKKEINALSNKYQKADKLLSLNENQQSTEKAFAEREEVLSSIRKIFTDSPIAVAGRRLQELEDKRDNAKDDTARDKAAEEETIAREVYNKAISEARSSDPLGAKLEDIRFRMVSEKKAQKVGDRADRREARQERVARYNQELDKQRAITKKLKSNRIEDVYLNDKGKSIGEGRAQRQFKWDRRREEFQDSLIFVQRLVEYIQKKGGRVSAKDNFYNEALRSMSIAAGRTKSYDSDIYMPLLGIVNRLREDLASQGVVKKEDSYHLVSQYLMAKHALERNRHICCDEIFAKAKEAVAQDIRDEQDKRVEKARSSSATAVEKDQKIREAQQWAQQMNKVCRATAEAEYDRAFGVYGTETIDQQLRLTSAKLSDKARSAARKAAGEIAASKSGNNRSGFTDEEAQNIIDKVETKQNEQICKSLCDSVREATNYTLDTSVKYGLMPSETAESYKSMYKYYVPLRGWEEKEDIDYSMLSNIKDSYSGGIINLASKTAKGRKSKAEDPLAYIHNMAQSANVMGEKNEVYQQVFRIVSENAKILETVAELPKRYIVTNDDGSEEATFILPEKALWEAGKVKSKFDKGYRWHKTAGQVAEHEVELLVGGHPQRITFKGTFGLAVARAIKRKNIVSPTRGAQTLNWFTRQMAANMTSRNPAFIFKNLVRDIGFAQSAYFIENKDGVVSSIGDNAALTKNMGIALSTIIQYRLRLSSELKAAKSGTAAPEMTENEKMYRDFIEGGGETGIMNLLNIEASKKLLDKMLRDMQTAPSLSDAIVHGKYIRTLADMMHFLGDISENLSRFATYLTDRQNGASDKEAIMHAKEITVNFNRSGANKTLGSWYAFFNATMQGGYRLLHLAKHYSPRFAAVIGGIAAVQFAAGFLSSLLADAQGPDKDGKNKYDNISDWVKFANIVMFNPLYHGDKTQYLIIPLPQNIRGLTYAGSLAADIMRGYKSPLEAFEKWASAILTETSPVDVGNIDFKDFDTMCKSAAGVIAPTPFKPIVEVATNRNFMGRPIYKNKNIFSSGTPQYKLVFNGTNRALIAGSKALNNWGGGTDYLSAKIRLDDNGRIHTFAGLTDINPAGIQHLFGGYFGGMFSFFNDIYMTAQAAVNPDENFEVNSIPLANIFYRQNEIRPGYAQWFVAREKVDKFNKALAAAKKADDTEEIARLQNNSYLVTYSGVFNYWQKEIDRANKDILRAETAQEKDALTSQRDDMIAQAAKELTGVDISSFGQRPDLLPNKYTKKNTKK